MWAARRYGGGDFWRRGLGREERRSQAKCGESLQIGRYELELEVVTAN